MKPKRPRKLAIRSEQVRQLDTTELKQIVGGESQAACSAAPLAPPKPPTT